MHDSVPSALIPIVEKVAKKLGCDKYETVLIGANAKGEGYLGEITFLEILDKTTGKSTNIVVKLAFKNEEVRQINPIRHTFLNEIAIYKTIIPAIQQFQNENGIPIFEHVPRCLLTSSEEGNEFIVFENIKLQGFELFDKTKILDYQHMEFIFKTYGKFHATTFLYNKFHPEKFSKLVQDLGNVHKSFFEQDIYRNMTDDVLVESSQKLKPYEDDKAIAAFAKYTKDGTNLLLDSLTYKGKYPVLCHGDCWSNNMMFKYDNDKNVSDIRLLDWQLARTGCPSQDLSYCLYSGASKDTFDRLQELLKAYYEVFSEVITQAGEDPQKMYPFEVLQQEWKEYCRFGLITSTIVIKMKMDKSENKIDLVDISTSEDKDEAIKKFAIGTPCEEYDSRIRELILHVYEIGGL